MDTKPCVVCKKQLESAVNDWKTLQPLGGGEIKLFLRMDHLNMIIKCILQNLLV